MHGTIQTLQRFQDYTAKSEEGGQSPGMDDSTESDNQILVSRSSIQSDEARTVESASAGSTGAQGFSERASRHWQVFGSVCTATSANRTDLDNAVGLLGIARRKGRAL